MTAQPQVPQVAQPAPPVQPTQPVQDVRILQAPRLQPWETFSLLLHAGSKLGKTSLAATAPKPIIALDAEGGWKFLPLRKIYWDPMREPVPVYDGSWDVCVVVVNAWETVDKVNQWLTQAPTPFVSIIVDSISELQRRCKANMKSRTEAMKIQDWGVLLAIMDDTIRGFRDLTLKPWSPVQCAVFIAESRESNSGKMVPYMQGQISIALPYWMDVVGYYMADHDPDENGQMTREVRRLLIGPNSQAEAGERVQGRLGQIITIPKPPVGQLPYPSIEAMMRVIYPQVNGQQHELPSPS